MNIYPAGDSILPFTLRSTGRITSTITSTITAAVPTWSIFPGTEPKGLIQL
ncbi:MAG: hypothetical protein K5744_05620 [Eubacterium sp.]|nr:hypothetical protein [Eubacterium sp.]